MGTEKDWRGSQNAADLLPVPRPLVQISLDRLHPGQHGIVVRVGGNRRPRGLPLEMGLVPSETVAVRNLAPLGDPIEFLVRGHSLSLRHDEARGVQVELTGGNEP